MLSYCAAPGGRGHPIHSKVACRPIAVSARVNDPEQIAYRIVGVALGVHHGELGGVALVHRPMGRAIEDASMQVLPPAPDRDVAALSSRSCCQPVERIVGELADKTIGPIQGPRD